MSVCPPVRRPNYPGCDQPCRPPNPDRWALNGRPSLRLSRLMNFRDPAYSAGIQRIKRGRLFRSSVPWDADEADARVLAEDLGIKTILDLRMPVEIQGPELGPLRSYASINTVSAPMLNKFSELANLFCGYLSCCGRLNVCWGGCSHGKAGIKEKIVPAVSARGLLGMYTQLLDHNPQRVKRALQLYTDEANFPILVHCTQGKDRTGLIIALVLLMAGAPVEGIIEDYNMSEEWSKEMHQKLVGVTSRTENTVDPLLARAPKGMMEAILAHLNVRYGSAEEYLDRIGFDASMRERVRANVAEGA